MEKTTIIALCISLILISCKNRTTELNPALFKYDWISENTNDNDQLYMTVLDSFMMENITGGEFPLSKYSISNDTLKIYSPTWDYNNHVPLFPNSRCSKFRIIKLDSVGLYLKSLKMGFMDTIIFKKITHPKKNMLLLERLEFSMSSCLGFCPALDILIRNDSMIYYNGYNIFSKFKGLNTCKLDSNQFARLQNRIYAIDRDNIRFGQQVPDAPRFYLMIKSKTDSIEIEGYTHENTSQDLMKLINHLILLEYSINLKPTDEEVIFKDKWNFNKYRNY